MFSSYVQHPATRFGHPARYASFLNTVSPFSNENFNQNPTVGLEAFLSRMGLGVNTEALVRQLGGVLQDRWQAQRIQQFANPHGHPQNWLNYLAGVNWNQELARLTPQQRREDPRQFMRPIRTLSF